VGWRVTRSAVATSSPAGWPLEVTLAGSPDSRSHRPSEESQALSRRRFPCQRRSIRSLKSRLRSPMSAAPSSCCRELATQAMRSRPGPRREPRAVPIRHRRRRPGWRSRPRWRQCGWRFESAAARAASAGGWRTRQASRTGRAAQAGATPRMLLARRAARSPATRGLTPGSRFGRRDACELRPATPPASGGVCVAPNSRAERAPAGGRDPPPATHPGFAGLQFPYNTCGSHSPMPGKL
jgi:hypothetical protein